MKKKMGTARGAEVRGAANGGFAPKSVRNMYKASDTVIVAKMSQSGAKRLDELLAEVMLGAAERGWGEDWKLVAPAWGGVSYYGIKNPIKSSRKKKK